MRRLIWLLLATVLLGAACESSSGPNDDSVPESQLTFLRFESAAVITTRQASFWVRYGEGRELKMQYADGEDFLKLKVGSNSLFRKPNGTLFLPGDSVRIDVQIDPANRVIVYFEPSGLLFNATAPAELEINYRLADHDIDGDGDEDADDDELEAALRVWKQERPGLPWLPQLTARIDDDEMRALVFGFTGFSMASN